MVQNQSDPVRSGRVQITGLGQNSVRVFANTVRCSERSGVRVSKRSSRVFGFVFCSALFFNCSVFCFVRPFRGCVLLGCFVRVFPPIVSLFGCFDWRNDNDLIRCFVWLLVITQCFVRSNRSGWLMFVLFDCFVWCRLIPLFGFKSGAGWYHLLVQKWCRLIPHFGFKSFESFENFWKFWKF